MFDDHEGVLELPQSKKSPAHHIRAQMAGVCPLKWRLLQLVELQQSNSQEPVQTEEIQPNYIQG